LDFIVSEGWRMEEAVDRVLKGRALSMILRSSRMELGDVTKPKQTDTTRRWKIELLATGSQSASVRTQIEFSSRQHPEVRTGQ
jgi:hypothetical protein